VQEVGDLAADGEDASDTRCCTKRIHGGGVGRLPLRRRRFYKVVLMGWYIR